MAYQRGSLKQIQRKGGLTWILRYRVNRPDGTRVEHVVNVGLVRDFRKERDALREIDRLSFINRINDEGEDTRIHFQALAEHYLKSDMGQDAVRPKSVNTIPVVTHYVRDYLIHQWGDRRADDIKPTEIQQWLKSLHDSGLAWTTISKIKGIMHRVYRIGLRHELITTNPVQHIETRTNHRLPRSRDYASTDAHHPRITYLSPPLRPCPDLRRDSAPSFGDSFTALVGHYLG